MPEKTLLNREIIKRIMEDVGIIPHPNFGKTGLTTKEFIIDKKLSMKDEFGKILKYNIYAGEITLKSPISKLKGLIADLSEDEISEFIFLFQMDEFPIYALKLIFDDRDYGLFLNYIENEDEESSEKIKWYEADTQNKAMALAGMERLANSGILWTPCKNYANLYEGLIGIVGMEED